MKKLLKFIFPVILLFVAGSVYSQQSKATVKVWGNCGMCKQVIEKAAIKSGASAASWDKNTKMLAVEFNGEQTDSKKIQMAVAASGYDTQDYTANAKAYSNLPGCCQYSRKTSSTGKEKVAAEKEHECTKEGCDKCKDSKSKMASCEKCGKECKDGCKDEAVCKSKGCTHKS